MLGRAGQPEQAQLADLHPGIQHDRQVRDVRQLEGDMPGETRVDEARGGVRERTQASSEGLPSSRPAMSSGQRDDLERRPEDELARVEDRRLVALRLEQARQVGLLAARVDEQVAVVLEDAEPAIEPDVDARGLDHRLVVGLEPHAPVGELRLDVAIGKQHEARLSGR